MTALPPLVEPGRELDRDELARYARHLVLPGMGTEGQRRLASARVLVVGAGGLGSPALLYLAAAGVGTLGIVDDDVVETSNLQRQVVHGVSDLGSPKTASARATVAEVNPHVRVVEHRERLTAANALDVLSGYDLVLDGTDAFATRYLVSDAAEVLGIPCVWGAIYRFTGQVATFWGAPPAGVAGVTYRDVFPEPPPAGASPDCATGGVLGAMCGTLGSVMATEAIKLVTGLGETLLGRLATYDALGLTWRHLTVRRDPAREPVTALLAGTGRGTGAADPYAVFCGLLLPDGSEPSDGAVAATVRTTVGELAALRADGPEPAVLDVREPWEIELAALPGARPVSSGAFAGDRATTVVDDVAAWAAGRPVHVLCKSGARSDRVARQLRETGLDARSVEGGMDAWLREQITSQ